MTAMLRLAWQRLGSRAALQSAITMVMRVGSVACNVAAAGVAVRLVGAERYGQLVLIVALTPWLALCALGTGERLTQVIVSAVHKTTLAQAYPTIRSVFVISGFAGLIGALGASAVVVWGLQSGHDPAFVIGGIITVAAIALLTPLGVSSPILIGQGLIAKDGFYKLAQPILYLVLSGALLLTEHLTREQAFVALSLAYALSFVASKIMGMVGSGGIAFLRHRSSPEVRRNLLQTAWPFFIVQIAALLAFQTDRFLVNRFATSAELGSYDFLVRIYAGLYMLFSVPLQHLWRNVAILYEEGEQHGIRRIVGTYAGGSVLFWLSVTALVVGLGPLIVSILSGGRLPLPGLSMILLVGLFFLIRGTTDVFTLTLYATGRQRETVSYGIAHGVAHVVLAWAGGVAFGVVGVLAGQVLAFLLSSFLPFLILAFRVPAEPSA